MINENFLFLSLFLPRIGLWWAWANSYIPANSIPFIGDFFMTLLFPRVLILIYIATTDGINGWFIAHLIFAIIAYTSGARASTSSSN